MPFLLGREQRIRKTAEYQHVYKGVKVVGRLLILFYARRDEGGPRVGITVSGKVGGSVIRNHAKRRIKEALMLELNESPVNADIVFVALGRIKAASFDDIRGDVRSLLKKVR